jgi:hypothetical protein
MSPPDRTLIYRVSRGGHVMGEFDIDRIVDLLDSGEFLWTDLCWHQRMSGWTPLANLRSEVAAAKAFPPVAATSAPVASGRRRSSPSTAAPLPVQKSTSGYAGWWWVVSGVSLGALIGLLTTHFFPTIVQVDRPIDRVVEKIVDRPVEVVRVVEKRVEVPAALTPEQDAAVVFTSRLFDPQQRRGGLALFRLSDKVKVFSNIEGAGAGRLSTGLIVSRVESAFRRQGFKVLSKDSEDYPFTVVSIGGVFLENKWGDGSVVGVSGSYDLEIYQPLICFNPYDSSGPARRHVIEGNVRLYQKAGTLNYGISNVHDITTVYERLAEEGANDLRKAQDN